MKKQLIILFALLPMASPLMAKVNAEEIERGRYLVKVTGCNDCHTPRYGLLGGDVPEKDWLIGDSVGMKGPWGVTYPANIRLRIKGMKKNDFVKYAKVMKTRPPMPWYSMNAMSEKDLASLYSYIVSLGPSENQVPQGLSPGTNPQGPYMDMTVISKDR